MPPPRVLSRTFALLAACLVGCSPSPGSGEPPPRQVRRELAQLLDNTEHLHLTEFRQEAPGRYAAEAKGPGGAAYRVEVTTQGRTLIYRADGGDRLLGGRKELPEPPFDEKHPQAVQWLRGLAFLVQALGAAWAALGRFGFRRRSSSRAETRIAVSRDTHISKASAYRGTLLAVFGAVNAAFAAWWVYQIVINWGGA